MHLPPSELWLLLDSVRVGVFSAVGLEVQTVQLVLCLFRPRWVWGRAGSPPSPFRWCRAGMLQLPGRPPGMQPVPATGEGPLSSENPPGLAEGTERSGGVGRPRLATGLVLLEGQLAWSCQARWAAWAPRTDWAWLTTGSGPGQSSPNTGDPEGSPHLGAPT